MAWAHSDWTRMTATSETEISGFESPRRLAAIIVIRSDSWFVLGQAFRTLCPQSDERIRLHQSLAGSLPTKQVSPPRHLRCSSFCSITGARSEPRTLAALPSVIAARFLLDVLQVVKQAAGNGRLQSDPLRRLSSAHRPDRGECGSNRLPRASWPARCIS